LAAFVRRRVFNDELKMTDSQRLLADYVENGSETAFRELVSRYINLVYSTAVRLVNGDAHLAEDIAQTVFMDLARQARALSQSVMLGGWLHRHTCFVAAKIMRSNRRRQFREKQAVEMNAQQDHSAANLAQVAPILDEAINQLGAQDRAAILLRFFEQRDLRSVGEAIGTSENAAQKRVTRALEQLRTSLMRRGVTLSAAGLATALAGEAVSAAPVGLAIGISSAALASAAASGGTALTLVKLMTMTKIKATVIGAIAVATVATPLVLRHQAQVQLRNQDQALRQRAGQLAEMQRKNEHLSNLLARANSSQLSKDQLSELMKLRGEVGLLRRQTNELGKSRITGGESSLAATPTFETATIPKESWAFVGYATPENALQSVAWAMSKGDAKTFLASLSPETQKSYAQRFEGKTESEIAALLSEEISQLQALRLDRKKVSVGGEVAFILYSEERDDGTTKTRDEAVMTFKNVGGEWKLHEPNQSATDVSPLDAAR
jgi:RNA polymerase sigma factor (sigma-70 family)